MKLNSTDAEYTPTPAQIRVDCREIQKTWTKREERQRRGDWRQWEVPRVREPWTNFRG